jgi:hypothetical protein
MLGRNRLYSDELFQAKRFDGVLEGIQVVTNLQVSIVASNTTRSAGSIG